MEKNLRFSKVTFGRTICPEEAFLLFLTSLLENQKNFELNRAGIDNLTLIQNSNEYDHVVADVYLLNKFIGQEILDNWAPLVQSLSGKVRSQCQLILDAIPYGENQIFPEGNFCYEFLGGIGPTCPWEIDPNQWNGGFWMDTELSTIEPVYVWLQIAKVRMDYLHDDVQKDIMENGGYWEQWNEVAIPMRQRNRLCADGTLAYLFEEYLGEGRQQEETVVVCDAVHLPSEVFAAPVVTDAQAFAVSPIPPVLVANEGSDALVEDVVETRETQCDVNDYVTSTTQEHDMVNLQQASGVKRQIMAVSEVIGMALAACVASQARWRDPPCVASQARWRDLPCGADARTTDVDEEPDLFTQVLEEVQRAQVPTDDQHDFTRWIVGTKNMYAVGALPIDLIKMASWKREYAEANERTKEAIIQVIKKRFKTTDSEVFVHYLYRKNTKTNLTILGTGVDFLRKELHNFYNQPFAERLMGIVDAVVLDTTNVDAFQVHLYELIEAHGSDKQWLSREWVTKSFDTFMSNKTGVRSLDVNSEPNPTERIRLEALELGLPEVEWKDFLAFVLSRVGENKDMSIPTVDMLRNFREQKLLAYSMGSDFSMTDDSQAQPQVTEASFSVQVGKTEYTLSLQEPSSVGTLLAQASEKVAKGERTSDDMRAEVVAIVRMQKLKITIRSMAPSGHLQWIGHTCGKHEACSVLALCQAELLHSGRKWVDVKGMTLSDLDTKEDIQLFVQQQAAKYTQQSTRSKLAAISAWIRGHASGQTLPKEMWLSVGEWQQARGNDRTVSFIAPVNSNTGAYQVILAEGQPDNGFRVQEIDEFLKAVKIGVTGSTVGHMAVWDAPLTREEATEAINRLVEGIAEKLIENLTPVSLSPEVRARCVAVRHKRNELKDIADLIQQGTHLLITGVPKEWMAVEAQAHLIDMMLKLATEANRPLNEDQLRQDVKGTSQHWKIAEFQSPNPAAPSPYPATVALCFALQNQVALGCGSEYESPIAARSMQVGTNEQGSPIMRNMVTQVVPENQTKLAVIAVIRCAVGMTDEALAIDRSTIERELSALEVQVLVDSHRHRQDHAPHSGQLQRKYVNEPMFLVMAHAPTMAKTAAVRAFLGLVEGVPRKVITLGSRNYEAAISRAVVHEKSGLNLGNDMHFLCTLSGLKKGTDTSELLEVMDKSLSAEALASICAIRPTCSGKQEHLVVCKTERPFLESHMFDSLAATDMSVTVAVKRGLAYWYPSPGTTVKESTQRSATPQPNQRSATPMPRQRSDTPQSTQRSATSVQSNRQKEVAPQRKSTPVVSKDEQEDGWNVVGRNGRKAKSDNRSVSPQVAVQPSSSQSVKSTVKESLKPSKVTSSNQFETLKKLAEEARTKQVTKAVERKKKEKLAGQTPAPFGILLKGQNHAKAGLPTRAEHDSGMHADEMDSEAVREATAPSLLPSVEVDVSETGAVRVEAPINETQGQKPTPDVLTDDEPNVLVKTTQLQGTQFLPLPKEWRVDGGIDMTAAVEHYMAGKDPEDLWARLGYERVLYKEDACAHIIICIVENWLETEYGHKVVRTEEEAHEQRAKLELIHLSQSAEYDKYRAKVLGGMLTTAVAVRGVGLVAVDRGVRKMRGEEVTPGAPISLAESERCFNAATLPATSEYKTYERVIARFITVLDSQSRTARAESLRTVLEAKDFSNVISEDFTTPLRHNDLEKVVEVAPEEGHNAFDKEFPANVGKDTKKMLTETGAAVAVGEGTDETEGSPVRKNGQMYNANGRDAMDVAEEQTENKTNTIMNSDNNNTNDDNNDSINKTLPADSTGETNADCTEHV